MEDRQKISSLYQFVKEFTELRSKTVKKISDYPWIKEIQDFVFDPENIKIYIGNNANADSDDGKLISIHRPSYEPYPEPNDVFKDWLKTGWDKYRGEVETLEYKEVGIKKVYFTDSEKRVATYNEWKTKRDEWAARQRIINRTRGLFLDVYNQHLDLARDSETLEMVACNGLLFDANDSEIQHPILLKRVKTEYDAENDILSIYDTEVDTQIYDALLSAIPEIQTDSVKELANELKEQGYHPFDDESTPDYLKVFIRQLSSRGLFCDLDIPNDWKDEHRLLMLVRPMFIVKKRQDGAIKALEAIVEDIESAEEFPSHLIELVSGGTIDVPENVEETIEEQLAAVGGEDPVILLSKEANREQLEIARRIEKYSAVLVQGPPGTGKTHTIANLLGHFLAQGKSVLVTSHTRKALSVLKDKLTPGMQNLCVSMIDDSNKDMEKSVEGIVDVLGRKTSAGLYKTVSEIGSEREATIKELSEIRKKLFSIINSECKNIVFNGEEVSTADAARFVNENTDEFADIIPGHIEMYASIPLSEAQLEELYRTNELVSEEDEEEMGLELPQMEEMMSPDEIEIIFNEYKSNIAITNSIIKENNWSAKKDSNKKLLILGEMAVSYASLEKLMEVQEELPSFRNIKEWTKQILIDGRKGGGYKQRWKVLVNEIDKVCEDSESYMSFTLGKTIDFVGDLDSNTLIQNLEKIIDIINKKGKLGKVDRLLNSSFDDVLNSFRVNGETPNNLEECQMVYRFCLLCKKRDVLAGIWDELMVPRGANEFYDLDDFAPEETAKKWTGYIAKCLEWSDEGFPAFVKELKEIGISWDECCKYEETEPDIVIINKMIATINDVIPALIEASISYYNSNVLIEKMGKYVASILTGKRSTSKACISLTDAVKALDIEKYKEAYNKIITLHRKAHSEEKRKEYLAILSEKAPLWAEKIISREGIHGESHAPANIILVWKWKQYCEILTEITKEPYEELQARSLFLSSEYRRLTAKYCENLAWYHLLRRTEADIDMKQALQGWKLTVKKIGKGTGKNAAMYRKQARELMPKCQSAVPAWIMPIGKALESLNPQYNKFDVVIIDEASQSDLSALAVAYMAKKLVVVGDDKQVSPLAVGVDLDNINALIDRFLKGVIPNSHLYTAKTSLYDLAATTFQPLMLREHFRCVPEIIGFSNALSYDYKIKPLRDGSENQLLPAVVNYRVADGKRSMFAKKNEKEAKSIVALMRACMEQSEYDGMSFGVISMLGDEQVLEMRKYINNYIEPAEADRRNLLCGNASNFQGDERDVIFLSLVDSNESDGVLRNMGFGTEDATRKRYNVASSRARNQLWVVHSLDASNDLQEGDLRKRLIQYAMNPNSSIEVQATIEEKSESPFEELVAKKLVANGYHIVQQWPVGAYRLDIVVVCGNQRVVIECDGDRYHSTEEQIRSDMERQTILERIGWRFIRIRGSEFFRNPDETMSTVMQKLESMGINPECNEDGEDVRDTELLQRVKARAEELLSEMSEEGDEEDAETVAFALETSHMEERARTEILGVAEDSKGQLQIDLENDNLGQHVVTGNTDFELENISLENDAKKDIPRQENVAPYIRDIVDAPTANKIEKKETKRQMPSIPDIYKKVSDKSQSANNSYVDNIINDLRELGLNVIDKSSGKILWVLYKTDKVEEAEVIFRKYNCKATLEARGAIATNYIKAWRVILPRGK